MKLLKDIARTRDAWFDTSIILSLVTALILHAFDAFGVYDGFILTGFAVIGVLPVAFNAVRSLREREWASMDSLALFALIFSMIEREWASAAFVALMLAAARLLETLTEGRMERSIRGLLMLRPEYAKVERNSELRTVSIHDVAVGDIVVIDAGERIAIDGTVIHGEAAVDESSLTGESLPVDKQVHDKVSSSTLVTSGSLRVATTHVGKDTMIERIITLVESSRAEKPNIESLGVRFGKVYLVGIFVGAFVLWLLTGRMELVLAVVLVVCADDVVIAIPLTYLRAIGTAARRGIIVKGSKHLEVLGNIDTIVFDKTGTLTYGKPQVSALYVHQPGTENMVLSYAFALSKHSSHPLSKAICAYAAERNIEPTHIDSAEVIGGRGVSGKQADIVITLGNRRIMDEHGYTGATLLFENAEQYARQGCSITYVAVDGDIVGFAALSDTVKEDARSVVRALRELGISRVVLLSGDNEHAAKALAAEVGITDWHANLLPEDKVTTIKKLSETGIVAMVGDGVNDAAALSIAHVGIAMGGLGSDGAIESAQIVLMHDDLGAIPRTIRLARRVRTISVQDFWIWGVSNVVGLALVFGGLIGPAGAAAYNFISDFFPLFNSLRAKFPR